MRIPNGLLNTLALKYSRIKQLCHFRLNIRAVNFESFQKNVTLTSLDTRFSRKTALLLLKLPS